MSFAMPDGSDATGTLPCTGRVPASQTTTQDGPRLARLERALGGEALEWIWLRLRERLARGKALEGKIALARPSPQQRAALDRLLGRVPSSGRSLTLDLAQLAAILRHAELCVDLNEAVEVLTGPVVNLRAKSRAESIAWRHEFNQARAGIDASPSKLAWLTELESSGLLRRLSAGDLTRAHPLLGQALEVANRLPANGIPLAELAAQSTGDSHALDRGPVATLAMRAVEAMAGYRRERGAESRRDLWASVGVLCDELSAPVLALNLEPAGDASLTDRTLALHRAKGEPVRLTLRQLLREAPRFELASAGHVHVHVCENPAVVAAAASRLGERCGPLVCTDGQPTAAVHRLLAQLRQGGARLLYHGDFDWGGVRIATSIMQRHGALPWRLGRRDYEPAAHLGSKLEGTPLPTAWDSELTRAMHERGRAVHEEQVMDELISDLER